MSRVDIPWFQSASKRQRYLVGVSGGADSVALLHLLVEAGFRNLIVCHLDHGLRGRASAADARFVARLAARLGLVLESGRVDIKARMRAQGGSMESVARQARHEFFKSCASKHRCKRVFLAHHIEDQAETVMWNLLRGSHGLRGMAEEQEIEVGHFRLTLLRPLLGLRKADLVTWLIERGLAWREDASNAQPVAVRNRLRHEVFPLLESIAGRDAVAAFARAAADDREWRDGVVELLGQAQLHDPQGRLFLPALRRLPRFLQRTAIQDHLVHQGVGGIDRGLLDRALGLLEEGSPAVINLPGGKRLRRRAGRIWVEE